jgi:hypothetical protein
LSKIISRQTAHTSAEATVHPALLAAVVISALAPSFACRAAPIVITAGGTYSGTWTSADPAVPAVTIRTTEPVILERCTVSGPGALVAARNADGNTFVGVDLTMRDCTARGIDPKRPGLARGHWVQLVYPKAVTIENNLSEHNRGINLIGDGTFGNVRKIKVLRNRFRNLDGRTTGGTCSNANVLAGTTTNGMCTASFVQVNGFLRAPSIEIGWNEIINTPGQRHGEDHVSVYNASGTPAAPLRVHDNYVRRAYPAQPATDDTTLAAIDAGDGDSTSDAEHGPAHIRVTGNQVVSSANAGIIVPTGMTFCCPGTASSPAAASPMAGSSAGPSSA